jgi:hypothetical protein
MMIELGSGVHTLVVTGGTEHQSDLVLVTLRDRDGGDRITDDVVYDATPIHSHYRRFEVTLFFVCDGTHVDRTGGEGETNVNPAELYIDVAVSEEFKRVRAPVSFWGISCNPAPSPRIRRIDDFKTIPLLVRVLQGVTVDSGEIVDSVREANKILAQAHIRLDFDESRIERGVVETTTTPNGEIEKDEEPLLALASLQVLKARFQEKGFVAVIADELEDQPDIAGLAVHGEALAFLKNDARFSVRLRGVVLAHEFAHAFTLGSGHVVDDKNTPRTRDDKVADKSGHTNLRRNLLRAIADETNDQLTVDQIAEFDTKAKVAALFRARSGDPVITRVDQKRAVWVDDLGEVTGGHIDLATGTLFAPSGTGDVALQVVIDLAGLHPAAADTHSRFELFFDTDNNPLTGATFDSFNGIDKVMRVDLSGQFPFVPPRGTMVAEWADIASGASVPLVAGTVERMAQIIDAEPPGRASVSDSADSIRQDVPLPLLGSLADQVPAGIRSTDLDTGESDEVAFVFEFNPPPGPLLVMSPLVGRPGEIVNLTGTNFSPGGTVSILVNDTEIMQTGTLADGSFSASFAFPALPPGDHFVTARDGSFDFSVFKVLPKFEIVGTASLTLAQRRPGVADDGLVEVAAAMLGPGQDIDPLHDDVTIEFSEPGCGGVFSRLAVTAGSFRELGVVTVFRGVVVDRVTGAPVQATVRFTRSGQELGMSLNLRRANYVCLEGGNNRRVTTALQVGEFAISGGDACFGRLSNGDLYFPVRTAVCP